MILNCPEWRQAMSTHPPLIDNQHSGETPDLPALKTIGVIGAGVMGVGLAHALAQSGLRTLLIDVSDSILESALGQIRNNARLQRLFHKDRGAAQEEILARITASSDYDILSDADFVIENVTEKLAIKAEVYSRLDAICPSHCIFAVNTSAIPITRIG